MGVEAGQRLTNGITAYYGNCRTNRWRRPFAGTPQKKVYIYVLTMYVYNVFYVDVVELHAGKLAMVFPDK